MATVVTVGAQMVAGSGQAAPKIDSALVAPFPKDFDIKTDIFTPGEIHKFQAGVRTALRSRKLLQACEELPPTMEALREQNPDATPSEIIEAIDILLTTRSSQQMTAAPLLATCVKRASLTLGEQQMLDLWSNAGEGGEVFVWLMRTTDPEGGKVQDEFKRGYAKITLTQSDSMAKVITQLNLKWFIYSSLRINDVTVESVAREGIREMLLMLIAGPKSVASEALLMLSAVESMTLAKNNPGGTWVAQRIALYERYGDQMALVNGDGGSLLL